MTVYVAANSDHLYGEFEGSFIEPNSFEGPLVYTTITGGTGRFENVTTPPGAPLIDANDGMVTGRISSVGSSK